MNHIQPSIDHWRAKVDRQRQETPNGFSVVIGHPAMHKPDSAAFLAALDMLSEYRSVGYLVEWSIRPGSPSSMHVVFTKENP